MKGRNVAILAAHLVGYSRYMELDKFEARAAITANLAGLYAIAIVVLPGRLVKTTGYGYLLEFASVTDAVRCAVVAQSATSERNLAIPADKRLQFCIGVSFGDVMMGQASLNCEAVKIARRLGQLAEPGGILLSGTAYDRLHGNAKYLLELVGEQHVKNLAHPVRVYRVPPDEKQTVH